MQFFVGVDGGGSETKVAVVTDTLEVIGRASGGASNHYVVGAQDAARNINAAVEQALGDARRLEPDLTPQNIAAWGFGLAGVRRENDAFKMRGELNGISQGQPWVLDTDAAAAQSGAFVGGPGIILSAGTGAICLGISEKDERFYADGWGAVLGDEGGGYWIGQEALRAVCRSADGRGPRTNLVSSILTTLALPDCDALVHWTHDPDTKREHIARLSRQVFDAAGGGGQVAIDIRERAVANLANSVKSVARRMLTDFQEETISRTSDKLDFPIALRGGLFDDDFFKATVGYNIGERMVELKGDYLPIGSWRIVKPQFDADVGAALLAQKSVAT